MTDVFVNIERAMENIVLYNEIERYIFGKNYRVYAIIRKTQYSGVWNLDFHKSEDALAFSIKYSYALANSKDLE